MISPVIRDAGAVPVRQASSAAPVPEWFDDELRLEHECRRFLQHEASLLDGWKFHDWLALMADDIDYQAPVRTARDMRAGDGFSEQAFFFQEDLGSLRMRVTRLDSAYAWAENPRTRTRRILSGIRPDAEDGLGSGTVAVASNLAVYCYRGEASQPLVLTCERRDVLRFEAGRWSLARRRILLDSTVLGLESLSIFL